MHILYGVQGTGNGHISRANAMAQALARYPDVKVTWLLSGRERARGCGAIQQFEWREASPSSPQWPCAAAADLAEEQSAALRRRRA